MSLVETVLLTRLFQVTVPHIQQSQVTVRLTLLSQVTAQPTAQCQETVRLTQQFRVTALHIQPLALTHVMLQTLQPTLVTHLINLILVTRITQ
jgi:hypothetical protein